MSTTFDCHEEDDNGSMRELLLAADTDRVEAPPDLVDRTRAALHQRRIRLAPTAGKKWPSKWARRAALLTFAGAVILMIAILLPFQYSGTAWADVAQAVRDKPWIHFKAVGAAGQPQELWMSLPRDVAAGRSGDLSRYDDFRTGVRFEYAHRDNKLFRLALPDDGTFQSIASVFQAIFQGDASVGERFAELEIVKQRKRTLDDRGQSWIEYELELSRGDQSDSALAVIRVDSDQMLPASLTLTADGKKLEFAIDYPAEGPADIYALGVPRDAAVDDRLPPADLKRIFAAIAQGRHDLDNYSAVVAESPNSLPTLVWRKGDKWRVDICQPTERTDYVQDLEPGTDMAKWWRARLNKFCIMPYLVCDGRRIDRCGIELEDGKPASSGWKLLEKVRFGREHTGQSSRCSPDMIELRAYPTNLCTESAASALCTIDLDPHGVDGPNGSVRVDYVVSGQKQQYWLDPNRRYVLVREELQFSPAQGGEHWTWECDDFRQSPRGVWYPTVVRRKTDRGVETTHFYLDFNAELPDDLFTRTPPPGN